MGDPNRATMRKLACLFVMICALSVVGCGDLEAEVQQAASSSGPVWTPPDPQSLAAQLQSVVDKALRDNETPGAVVGVFTPNGQWTSATGLGDVQAQQAISLNDSLAWRSITKSLTVTIVLQLVAEGKLSLDAPVGTYVSGVPNGDNITLRHLASMRSGLFEYTKDQTFRDKFSADLSAAWTDQEILSLALAHPVSFNAGAQYDYCNTNTVLLGVVAESVTGQSLKQLIEDRILKPLAMNRSAYMTGIELPAPFARAYVLDDDTDRFEEVVCNGTSLSGAGAMAGTLGDLRTWGQALVAGTLLPANLQSQRFGGGPATNGPFYNNYGLGMGEIRGWWGHTGVGVGYEAGVMTEPNTGSQIVVLVNATNGNSDVPADIVSEIQDVMGWPVVAVSRQ